MGILYNVPDLKTWGIMFFILVVLIALNELGRETKWGGILLFVIVPVVLTIFESGDSALSWMWSICC